MASIQQLRRMIAEILEVADLNTITAKKVRQEMEEKLNQDLSDRKKEIDDMVLEILQEKQNGNGEAFKRKLDDSDDEDHLKRARAEEEVKKPAPKGKRGGTGYTKLCRLSPELAKLMGEDSMARHEVVKKMWGIIKEKQLYDPKNKQFAICNDELLPVFGTKRFRTFGMMKYLKNHFLD